MTDFSFTGYFSLTFEKITPVVTCITDLSASINPHQPRLSKGNRSREA
jgi:hypothetical protein